LSYIEQDEIKEWDKAQNCVNLINHLLERLLKDDNEWKKMPRSMDFPANGIEFIKQWKSSILDKIAIEIQGQMNKSSNIDILDINDWNDVKTFVRKIDKLI
jgi:hypothetical protein